MAAAVGQTRLMHLYAVLMAEHRIPVGQILLTHGDLRHRQRHLNARNTMLNLLRHARQCLGPVCFQVRGRYGQ